MIALGQRPAHRERSASLLDRFNGLTMAQVYARLMLPTFFIVGLLCVIRPLTDASGSGLFFWSQPANTFGVFLINWAHFVLHVAISLWALFALQKHGLSRGFARGVFWICAVLIVIGLVTPNGLLFVPGHWPQDLATGHLLLSTPPAHYLYFPLNFGDDVVNVLFTITAFVFGFLPIGSRAWGFWRKADEVKGYNFSFSFKTLPLNGSNEHA